MTEYKSTVLERMSYLYEIGKHCDVEFLLTNGDKIKGHKLIFAMSSPVFDAMLFGEIAEKSDITIEDIEPDAFKQMVKYIYSDEVIIKNVKEAIALYQTANKYDLPHIMKICLEYILFNVDVANAALVYEFGKLHDINDLKIKCVNFFEDQTNECLSSEIFLECSIDTVETIAALNRINITEFKLFSFIENWAKEKCSKTGLPLKNYRHALNNVIKSIRFLTMEHDEFVLLPYRSPLLSMEEKNSILMNINESGSIPIPDVLSNSTENRHKNKFKLFCTNNFNLNWIIENASKGNKTISPSFYICGKKYNFDWTISNKNSNSCVKISLKTDYDNTFEEDVCLDIHLKLSNKRGYFYDISRNMIIFNDDKTSFTTDFIQWNDFINGHYIEANDTAVLEANLRISQIIKEV